MDKHASLTNMLLLHFLQLTWFHHQFSWTVRIEHYRFYAYKILVSANVPVYILRGGFATAMTHFDLPIAFFLILA